MKTILATMVLLAAAAANAGAQEVDIAFREGRVSLGAHEAPVASVLAVWSKVGQTDMKGTELLEKRVITLKLADVAEAQALQLILGREFHFSGGLKGYAEPGTSAYAYVSIAEAGPWVDPEVKYVDVYSVPEKAVGDFRAPQYQPFEGEWLDPEVKYQYYTPEKAWSAGPKPTYPWVDPREWKDPEVRFEYYSKFEAGARKPIYPSTSNPNPWVDPEVRFTYTVPNKSR